MSAAGPVLSTSSLRARERLVLLVIVLCGLALRSWDLGSTGLDHFDEGVYAYSSQALSAGEIPEGLYPRQEHFSPPVYFGLSGLASRLTGVPAASAAIGVNVALGTLTILALFQVVRFAFGVPAGLAAATLVAFNEYHIGLSRCGLTDVTFSFAFLIAIGAMGQAVERRSYGWAVGAGLAIGLAWNTKYHGWLAIPIGVAAFACDLLWRRLREVGVEIPWRRLLGVAAVVVAVAVLCYLPWFLYVESTPGGYAGLLEYQGDYVKPNPRRNFVTQASLQYYLDGSWSRFALPAAYLAAVVATPGFARGGRELVTTLGILSLGSLTVGSTGTAMALTILSILRVLFGRAGFVEWLILGFFGTFFVATPFYTPYARLALPLLLGTFAVASLWIARPPAEAVSAGRSLRSGQAAIWSAAAAGLVFALSHALPSPSSPWRPGNEMERAVAEMNRVVGVGERVVVIGEPSVAYYFDRSGRPAFADLEGENIEQETETVYLVRGNYSRIAPPIYERLDALGGRLVPLASYPVRPKDLRLLDDKNAEKARAYRREPDATFDLDLYRLQPASAAAAAVGAD